MLGLEADSDGGTKVLRPGSSIDHIRTTPPTGKDNDLPMLRSGAADAPQHFPRGGLFKRLVSRGSSQNTVRGASDTKSALTGGTKIFSQPGLESLRRVLSKTIVPLEPLNSVIDDLSRCMKPMDRGQHQSLAEREYLGISIILDELLQDLSTYLESLKILSPTPALEALALGINKEVEELLKKQQRGSINRLMDASEDLDAIELCYRRIQAMLERIKLNIDLEIWQTLHEDAMEKLLDKLPYSAAAKYNSAASATLRRVGCTENTRLGILQNLWEWANSPTSEKVYWLNGMAGTGKTTIAYSLCEALKKEQRLAASFFCSQKLAECRDVNRIIPTIAHQMSHFSGPFRCALSRVLRRDPDTYNQRLHEQFKQLIVLPLVGIKSAMNVCTSMPMDLVVVIDALDECEDKESVGGIIQVLIQEARNIPIKFFVASRPGAKILDEMQKPFDKHSLTGLRLHELERSIVEADIRTYLQAKLASRIDLQTADLEILVKRSGVLFIYAATITRYISSDNFSRGSRRLEEVLNMSNGSWHHSGRDMDVLYTAILEMAFDDLSLSEIERAEMKIVLNTIVCAAEPLSVDILAGLLKLDPESSVRAALRPLSSVLQISGSSDLITILHKSFSDYLLDKRRSGRFHCNAESHNAYLAHLCFELLNLIDPPFNICRLDSSYKLDRDVHGLKEEVEKTISSQLFYACKYWGTHLRLAMLSHELGRSLKQFASERILLWMEIMSLKKHMEYIPGVPLEVFKRSWSFQDIQYLDDSLELLRDACRFGDLLSSLPADFSTPHIYTSILLLWPNHRPIARWYKGEERSATTKGSNAVTAQFLQPLFELRTRSAISSFAISPCHVYLALSHQECAVEIWDIRTQQMVGQSMKGHTRPVRSITFSPDSSQLASGSMDNTVRTWSVKASQGVLRIFKNHTDIVSSVLYSPDGSNVASASDDGAICIWDVHDGRMIHELRRDGGLIISCVAYSPSGKNIVAAYEDRTLCIWDIQANLILNTSLQMHTKLITSMIYLPDGTRIVSGSHDGTLCIWDAYTGKLIVQGLGARIGSILSVACSPDGERVVCGSNWGYLYIWHAQKGQMIGQSKLQSGSYEVRGVAYITDDAYIVVGGDKSAIYIWDAFAFGGHFHSVTSIACSPSSAYIASGSWDGTVFIWDAVTGVMVGNPASTHKSCISSIAYSPDGTSIVSGSWDGTMQIWDVHSSQAANSRIVGHQDRVLCVIYSPDGSSIASGYANGLIQTWDSHSGKLTGETRQGHKGAINSIAYSPDGTHIISASSDSNLAVWDLRNSDISLKKLKGHTGSMTSVAYSPGGAFAVSGSRDGTLHIWDTKSYQSLGDPLRGHNGAVLTVAYSPNGQFVASGSEDSTIWIWDVRFPGNQGRRLCNHTDWVNSVVFSPDGTYLASGSCDLTIRTWDVTDIYEGRSLLQDLDASFSKFNPLDNPFQSANESLVAREPLREHLGLFENLEICSPEHLPPVCKKGHQESSVYRSWRLRDDGWIVFGDTKLLAWVPSEMRGILRLDPRNLMITGNQWGFLQLNIELRTLGDNWAK